MANEENYYQRSNCQRRKNTVKVWVRLRPTSKFPTEALEVLPDKKSMCVCVPLKKVFKYDGVLHNTSQEETFATVVTEVIDTALSGKNGLIMCYGQTGAGKTYTMTGMAQNYNNRGLIPRSLTYLFQNIDRFSHTLDVSVKISYMEIYDDKIYDLLSNTKSQASHRVNEKAACGQSLEICEGVGGVNVKGLSYHTVQTVDRAFCLLFEGEASRAIAAHSLNPMSSQSHCIFTVKLELREMHHNNPKYKTSDLIFVDLAGSEKVSRPTSVDPQAAEAISANRSLAFLDQVFHALAKGYRPTYRLCKLTRYLQSYIGGQCHTHIIANIWAERPQLEETVFTLQVAQCIKSIPMEPAIRELFEANICRYCSDNYKMIQNIPELEEDVQYLAKELAFNTASTVAQPVSPTMRKHLANQCQNYLEGTEATLTVSSLQEAAIMFQEMKEAFRRKKKADSRETTLETTRRKPTTSSRPTSASHLQQQRAGESVDTFDSKTIQLKISSYERKEESPASFRTEGSSSPSMKSSKDRQRPTSPLESARVNKGGKPLKVSLAGTTLKEMDPVQQEKLHVKLEDKQEVTTSPSPEVQYSDLTHPCLLTVRSCAFEEFKQDKGKELYTKLLNNKTLLQEKKQQQFVLSAQINKTKREIDQEREKLRMLATQRKRDGPMYSDDGDIVISHTEYLAIKHLQALKTTYHASCRELRQGQEQKQELESQIQQGRQQLVKQFEKWFALVTTAKEEETPGPGSDLMQYDESLQEAEHQAGRLQYPQGSKGTGKAVACPKHPIFPLIPRKPPEDKFAEKRKEVFKDKDAFIFYNSKSSTKCDRVYKAAQAQ